MAAVDKGGELMKSPSQRGFTIVELLIVIVVIGILAAITIVAYNGIQNRAKVNRAQSDMASLVKAIQVARINTDKPLTQITGSTDSRSTKALADAAFDAIAAASNTNLAGLKSGDPWGNWYRIDENEKEFGNTDCRLDVIQILGQSISVQVPLSQSPCV